MEKKINNEIFISDFDIFQGNTFYVPEQKSSLPSIFDKKEINEEKLL